MKKYSMVFTLIAAMLFSVPAFAYIEMEEGGSKEGRVSTLNVSTGLDHSRSGGVGTLTIDSTVHASEAVSAMTASATPTLTVQPGRSVHTMTITTDNQDQTITASGAGSAGDEMTIIFTTDAAGSGDEVITFHSTLMKSTGTLTLANLAADIYTVTFVSTGTQWVEKCRTAVQTT